MKGYIVKGASTKIAQERARVFRNVPFPKEFREYINKVRELEGKILDIEFESDDRVLVKYPAPIKENGLNIVGLSIESKYVMIL